VPAVQFIKILRLEMKVNIMVVVAGIKNDRVGEIMFIVNMNKRLMVRIRVIQSHRPQMHAQCHRRTLNWATSLTVTAQMSTDPFLNYSVNRGNLAKRVSTSIICNM
jgi:hypothetical protein